jgi:hypothetical protein
MLLPSAPPSPSNLLLPLGRLVSCSASFAHVAHSMGLSFGDERTMPNKSITVERSASTTISAGSDAAGADDLEVDAAAAAVVEVRSECS